MTILHSVEQAFVDRLYAQTVPIDGQIHLNEICNWECVHCYRLDLPRADEMNGEEWCGLVDQIAAEGGMYLTVSGGEATLHAAFWRILERASLHKFQITLFTNGTRVDDAAARRFKALGLREVGISIHGASAGVHDAFTRTPGSFDRAIGAVRACRAAGLKTVVKMSLMRMNLDDAPALGRIVLPLGAIFNPDYTILPRFNPAGGLAGQEHLAHRLTEEEIVRVEREYLSWTNRERPARKEEDDDPTFCTMGQNRFAIGPQGQFYPCSQVQEAVGEVRRTPFRKVWRHSARLNALRARAGSSLAVCKTCDWNDVCKLRCMGQNQQESGEYASPAPERCRITIATAKAAGTADARPRRPPPPLVERKENAA